MMFFDMHDDLDTADLLASLVLAPESERVVLLAELSQRFRESTGVDAIVD